MEAVQRMRRETTNYIPPSPLLSLSKGRRDRRKNQSKGGKKGRTEEPKPRKQRRENDNESKRALSDQRALGMMPPTWGPPPDAQPEVREHEVVYSWVRCHGMLRNRTLRIFSLDLAPNKKSTTHVNVFCFFKKFDPHEE